MKYRSLVLAAALALSPAAAIALDSHHSAAGTQASPASDIANMEERMRLMDGQMAKIRSTKDPKQRERLLDEHMRTMHESLAMMTDIHASGDSTQRIEILERRVDFTQQMLQQLLERRNFEAH